MEARGTWNRKDGSRFVFWVGGLVFSDLLACTLSL
jgi:hypothetical protein